MAIQGTYELQSGISFSSVAIPLKTTVLFNGQTTIIVNVFGPNGWDNKNLVPILDPIDTKVYETIIDPTSPTGLSCIEEFLLTQPEFSGWTIVS